MSETRYPSVGRHLSPDTEGCFRKAAASEPEFYFERMPIGYFAGIDGPRGPGCYRYEPYRGSGHYEMQTILRAGGSPRCAYEAEGGCVAFTVVGCPKYGVLELAGFEFTRVGAA